MLNRADKTDVSRRHALMLVVTRVAACYPAIKPVLVYAPPIRFAHDLEKRR
jgi:hypothetical protein